MLRWRPGCWTRWPGIRGDGSRIFHWRLHCPVRHASRFPRLDGLNPATTTDDTAGKSDVTTRLRIAQDGGSLGEERDRAVRARHLLRSILRECTYLPDSVTRRWMTQYTLQRFRRYTFFAWEKRDESAYEDRLRAKEKEARRWLAYLLHANSGWRSCLRKTLFMAYGRIGKRRRRLMRPLMINRNPAEVDESRAVERETNEDEDAEEDLELGIEDEENGSQQVKPSPDVATVKFDPLATQRIAPPLTPPLKALITSQIRAAPPNLGRTTPRRVDLIMPMYNSWLRPMPQVRVKNKLHQHYAELLDHVLPPLPTAEWKRLLDLASGVQPVEPVPPRRQSAMPSPDESPHEPKHTALEYVVAFGKPPDRLVDRPRTRSLSPRFMRRLYAEVLSQCPLMDWDAKTQQWIITWGGQALKAASLNGSAYAKERGSSTHSNRASSMTADA